MQWRKDIRYRRLMGHLSGYGCRVDVLKTVDELYLLSSLVFGIENTCDPEQMVAVIKAKKEENLRRTRQEAFDNVKSMWSMVETYWTLPADQVRSLQTA